jgi:MerR family transcriptional regulator, thiopeptide resistance regulator
MPAEERTWRVGQLARETGLTVRTLHHYEAITKMDKYFTPEQEADLARRADALGPDGMRKAEQDWAQLIDEVRAEMAAGTAPGDPRLTSLTDRWRKLVQAFTGGDLGVARGVAQRYQDEGWETPSRGMLDASVMEYMSEAIQHSGGWG